MFGLKKKISLDNHPPCSPIGSSLGSQFGSPPGSPPGLGRKKKPPTKKQGKSPVKSPSGSSNFKKRGLFVPVGVDLTSPEDVDQYFNVLFANTRNSLEQCKRDVELFILNRQSWRYNQQIKVFSEKLTFYKERLKTQHTLLLQINSKLPENFALSLRFNNETYEKALQDETQNLEAKKKQQDIIDQLQAKVNEYKGRIKECEKSALSRKELQELTARVRTLETTTCDVNTIQDQSMSSLTIPSRDGHNLCGVGSSNSVEGDLEVAAFTRGSNTYFLKLVNLGEFEKAAQYLYLAGAFSKILAKFLATKISTIKPATGQTFVGDSFSEAIKAEFSQCVNDVLTRFKVSFESDKLQYFSDLFNDFCFSAAVMVRNYSNSLVLSCGLNNVTEINSQGEMVHHVTQSLCKSKVSSIGCDGVQQQVDCIRFNNSKAVVVTSYGNKTAVQGALHCYQEDYSMAKILAFNSSKAIFDCRQHHQLSQHIVKGDVIKGVILPSTKPSKVAFLKIDEKSPLLFYYEGIWYPQHKVSVGVIKNDSIPLNGEMFVKVIGISMSRSDSKGLYIQTDVVL